MSSKKNVDSVKSTSKSTSVPPSLTNVKPKALTKTAPSTKLKSTITSTPASPTSPTQTTSIEPTETIEERYSSKDFHKAIMDESGMWIGSKVIDSYVMWVYDEEEDAMIYKVIQYVPGLYKIFDEILVNTRDQTVRDPTCKIIKVYLDRETGTISCYNDGDNGIPVEIHKVAKVYVPEMIFGTLLTSGNYNKTGKTTGGKHGLGAKLANIFSDRFTVEVVDSKQKKKFSQTFTDNMYKREEPKITKSTGKSYTQITFHPDYKFFGVDEMNEDTYNLFQKRVYDIAAIIGSKVKVYLNDKHINIPSFEDYVDMFYKEPEDNASSEGDVLNDLTGDEDNESVENDEDSLPKLKKSRAKGKTININKICTETPDKRWQVCVVYDNTNGFRQISYVNSICTSKGGTHVNYVVDMIVRDLNAKISERHKDVQIKDTYIRENFTFFINCIVEDPDFDSQTKETLTSRVSSFGSKFSYPEEFIKKILKTRIEAEVVAFSKLKEMSAFKPADAGKKGSLRDLTKLRDAKEAGGKRSQEARLILTEGDSAKTMVISGFEEIGTDLYGVFPLRGKMLNVRAASVKQVYENKEIMNVMRIIGLDPRKEYIDTKKLRYGGIIILTDQDSDGFHIKGLIMNFIDFYWRSLWTHMDDFIQTMSTPILKAFLKSDYRMQNAVPFMTTKEYLDWTKTIKNLKDYKIKYYKGLGTFEPEEAVELFEDFQDKIVSIVRDKPFKNVKNPLINCDFTAKGNEQGKNKNKTKSSQSSDSESDTAIMNEEEMINDPNNPSNHAINLAFDKKKANDRKKWLENYDENDVIENDVRTITVCQFVHKGLKHFSAADNVRSIPSICDGLKPSNRKILDTTIRKKLLRKTIKVVQLGGAVMELTNYHHGDASLYGTIISMAQRFVGSNNISLLFPAGQFGSRLQGGEDASAPRYIETRLDDLTPLIVREEDNIILERMLDDGIRIEPNVFSPIIPLILVNGTQGIGTGFSTFVPCYNPIDIINNIILLINNKQPKELIPWYRGFKGAVEKNKDKNGKIYYKTYGNYEEVSENTIRITELPIGTWSQKYKEFLTTLTPEGVADAEKAKAKLQKGKPGTKGPKVAKTRQAKIQEPIIKTFMDECSDIKVNFLITFMDNEYQNLIKNNSMEKKLKLSSSLSINNLHLWDYKDHKIKRYKNVEEILKDFYKYKLSCYELRKQRYSVVLENDMNIAFYRIKFLKDYIAKKIIVDKKQKKQVLEQLEKLKYPQLSRKITFESETEQLLVAEDVDEVEAGPEELDEEGNAKSKIKNEYKKSYKYITSLPLFSLTVEKLEQLEKEYDEKKVTYETYLNTPAKNIWLNELNELQVAYGNWLQNVEARENKPKKGIGKQVKARKIVVKK